MLTNAKSFYTALDVWRNMEAFFEPRGVAVIGASTTPGKIGHEVLRSIVGSSYSGSVYAVNPNADEILGVPSLPSLEGDPHQLRMSVEQ